MPPSARSALSIHLIERQCPSLGVECTPPLVRTIWRARAVARTGTTLKYEGADLVASRLAVICVSCYAVPAGLLVALVRNALCCRRARPARLGPAVAPRIICTEAGIVRAVILVFNFCLCIRCEKKDCGHHRKENGTGLPNHWISSSRFFESLEHIQ